VRPLHDGTVPDHSAAPDPYEAVRATVKVNRTRKGRTQVKVLRHGDVFVIGSEYANGVESDGRYTDCTARVHLTTARALIAQCRLGARGGRSAIDLVKLTNRAYALPMVGTDVRAYAQIIPSDLSTAHLAAPCARHRSELVDAGCDVPDIVRHAAQRDAAHDATTASQRARERVGTIVRRKRDPEAQNGTQHLLAQRSDGTSWFAVRELDAPADDPATMFVGHRRVIRGETDRDVRDEGTQRRAARTIGHDENTADETRVRALCDTLNRGERVTFSRGAVSGTISRAPGKAGQLAYSVKVNGVRVTHGVARTADRVAVKVSPFLA
jgi:hypothetical protein